MFLERNREPDVTASIALSPFKGQDPAIKVDRRSGDHDLRRWSTLDLLDRFHTYLWGWGSVLAVAFSPGWKEGRKRNLPKFPFSSQVNFSQGVDIYCFASMF